jgi:hypothetical protein
MGERTDFQLIVYDCPADQCAAVIEILNDFDLDFEHELGSAERSHSELFLGRTYTDHSYGALSDDVGAQFVERAPGAIFTCWTSPAYEYLGNAVMYAPDLGKFTADCDANGTPLLSQDELRRAILAAPAPATREEIADAVDCAAGAPWLDRIDQLRQRLT